MSTVTVKFVPERNRWEASFRYDPAVKDFLKFSGFRWDPDRKVWWTQNKTLGERFSRPGAVEEAMRQAQEASALSRSASADIEVPAPPGLSYLPFQRAGIAYALTRSNCLIADEMGLGKTVQAIGVANASAARRVLVICPAFLRLNWRNEWRRWDVQGLTVAIAESGKALPPADVVIASYEAATKMASAIRQVQWDLLIVDECHYVKNPDAQRTKAVLGDKKTKLPPIPAKRRLFLTGTPIVNRPIELWPLVEALDPNGLGASFWAFAKRYCDARHDGWGWRFDGASNLEELQQRLRSTVMVRRQKKDVLTELPPKIRQVVLLEAKGMEVQRALREEAQAWQRHEDLLTALRVQAELAKAIGDQEYEEAIARLRNAAKVAFEDLSLARHALALAKVPAVVEHVQEVLDAKAKVVVFAWHQDVAEAIARAFAPASVLAHGGLSDQVRQAAVQRFQSDPATRVFVGTIRGAGVGITLTASDHVVFAELWWVPGDISQAEDRCHRIGQVNPVLVQHLVVDGSLDARMAHVIVAKQGVIDRALDRQAQPQAAANHDPVTPAPIAATQDVRRSQLAAIAQRLSPDAIAAVHSGLRLLAAVDTDRAKELNAVGYNKVDSAIGHALADMPALTPMQAALGACLLRKYHRQLPADINAVVQNTTAESR